MAKLNKIVPSNPISNFRQVTPDTGGAFRLLADSLSAAYEIVEPAAIEDMQRRGTEFGQELARKQIGNPRSGVVSSQGDDIEAFNASLAKTESGGRFDVVNKEGFSGKYQFGQPRLDDFNRANGTNYTTADLVANTDEAKALTETVQRWHINDIDGELGQFVGSEVGGKPMTLNAIRAMAHLGGKGGARRFIESGGEYDPADSNGTRLSDYARIHGGAPTVSSQGTSVIIRNDKGQLEGRKYSPYSGPILRAHDAAAAVAYHSEMINKSAEDMMGLANQFALDPEGFGEAAEAYVDSMVENAPENLQADLSNVLRQEAQRQKLGIMEARHRDIRQRANNSSAALVSRWQTNYSEALASGDPEEIEAARRQLDGLLQAREKLPGISWTDAQSANILIDAQRNADKITAARRKEVAKEQKSQFELITKAAKSGAIAEGEDILSDPEAIANHPELAREAAAFTALRDNLPEFLKMTPAEQAEAVARMAAAPVSEEWELDIVDAARTVVTENKKAWSDDPVKRAQETLDIPPPELVPFGPETADDFIDALAERREYMNSIFERGYTDTEAFLSKEEAESIAALMSRDTPPEVRAAMSAAIVSGFGSDAVRVFGEINADEVTMFAGKMMALGANPAVANEILTGQQMIDDGLVQIPPKADRIDNFDATIAQAFSGIPDSLNVQKEVLAAAVAIYGARARGVDPSSDAAAEIMTGALQTALGQSTNKRGQTTGGIQQVMGQQTLLPVGVAGADVDEVLRTSLTGIGFDTSTFAGGLALAGRAIFGGKVEAQTSAWDQFGGAPLINGKPIPPEVVTRGDVRIVPATGGMYRMEILSGNTRLDAEDANGNVMFFDLQKLMEAAQ